MDTQEYNGHANWATWNVSLWLNNDEGYYRSVMVNPISADDIEEFVRGIFESTGKFGDIEDFAELDNVRWDKIYENATE